MTCLEQCLQDSMYQQSGAVSKQARQMLQQRSIKDVPAAFCQKVMNISSSMFPTSHCVHGAFVQDCSKAAVGKLRHIPTYMAKLCCTTDCLEFLLQRERGLEGWTAQETVSLVCSGTKMFVERSLLTWHLPLRSAVVGTADGSAASAL